MYGFEKIKKMIIKKDTSPDYLWDIFLSNLLITFRHYYYAKYAFVIFNTVDLFQIFVTSQSTEILIVSNFWLGVYT